MAVAEKEFDGQTCLKRRTILRLGVPKERRLFTTTSGGRTKASPKRDRRSGTRRSRVKRANSFGKDERSEFLAGEEQNKGSYQSGQMGQTVNLLAYAFGGSNPSLPTRKRAGWSCKIRTMRGSRASERGRLTLIRYVFAEVAQLIEHQPSKLRVASLSLVFRSRTQQRVMRMHSVPPGRKRLCRPLVLRNENEMNFKTLGQFLTIL